MIETGKTLRAGQQWLNAPRNEWVSRQADVRTTLETLLELVRLQSRQLYDLRRPRKPNKLGRPAGVLVLGTPQEQAGAMWGAEGPVDAYRYPSGAITWRKRGGLHPRGADFVGSYDEGCDYRDVLADMEVLA